MPTFYDRFVECAERWPQNVAVEVQRPDGIESYSYAQLRRMAEAIGASLLHRGLDPGAASYIDGTPRDGAGGVQHLTGRHARAGAAARGRGKGGDGGCREIAWPKGMRRWPSP